MMACPECRGFGKADVGGCPICGKDRRSRPWRRGFALVLVLQTAFVGWAVWTGWPYRDGLLVYYFFQFLTRQADRLG